MKTPETEKVLSECLPRWKESGWLEGLEDYQAEQVALILENQRLCTEIASPQRPWLLPLVREVYKSFLPFHWVSVQTMIGKTDEAYIYTHQFTKKGDKTEVDLLPRAVSLEAKSRIMRASVFNQEPTEEEIPDLARSVRNEITREILTDLRNSAGTIAKVIAATLDKYTYEDLYIKICEISGVVHRKSLRSDAKRWIVTSPKIAGIIPSQYFTKPDSKEEIRYLGCLNCAWDFYVDEKYPENELLYGLYNQHNGGYVYAPYILGVCPVQRPEGYSSFLARYAKKLTIEGSKFYARLKFEDVKDES